MKQFALLGVAGYIAPKHLKAIKDTGNNLVAAFDPKDSVGLLDSYYPDADFFVEFERFDRHIEKLKHDRRIKLDYVSICTPNYLHDAHVRFALRYGADAICEKPLVSNPWNIDALRSIERDASNRIYTILQLRLHPSIIALKNEIESGPQDKVYDIDLTYITSRGKWYHTSWKGDINKSGGIATNIGVHFFDMLTWIFGKVKTNVVHLHTYDRAAGYLELEKARVRWFLSIDYDTLPTEVKQKSGRTFRSILIEGKEMEFSDGFTDLHTLSYKKILDGNGYGVEDCSEAIELVYTVRNANPIGLRGDFHPFASKPLSVHPFKRS